MHYAMGHTYAVWLGLWSDNHVHGVTLMHMESHSHTWSYTHAHGVTRMHMELHYNVHGVTPVDNIRNRE
jgi:hypothetical protein